MILNDTFYTFSLNLLVFGFYLYLAERYNCILVIFRIENSKAFDFEIGICEKKICGCKDFSMFRLLLKQTLIICSGKVIFSLGR